MVEVVEQFVTHGFAEGGGLWSRVKVVPLLGICLEVLKFAGHRVGQFNVALADRTLRKG